MPKMLQLIHTDACSASHAKLKVSLKVTIQEHGTPFLATCGLKSLILKQIWYFGFATTCIFGGPRGVQIIGRRLYRSLPQCVAPTSFPVRSWWCVYIMQTWMLIRCSLITRPYCTCCCQVIALQVILAYVSILTIGDVHITTFQQPVPRD